MQGQLEESSKATQRVGVGMELGGRHLGAGRERKAVERVLTMEYPPAQGQQTSVPEALAAAAAATEWR